MSFQPNGPQREERQSAISPYVRAIRTHWLLVGLTTVVAITVALYVLSRQEPTYEATAQVLVTPVEDQAYLGLDLVRNSGDPERTAQTAAGLLESAAAAQVVAERVGGMSAQAVQDAVQVRPEGESNLLAVTATANTSERAVLLADGFAEASLSLRRESVQRQLDELLPRLQRRRRSFPEDDFSARQDLIERINELESIRSSERDPTLQITRPASAVTTPVGVSSLLIAGLGVLAGLVIGGLGALLLEIIKRRIRDEDELISLYPLPVLARVPPAGRGGGKRALSPFDLPPAAREAFRGLRAQIESTDGSTHSVMLTSASAGDGKTTAATSLAAAFAEAHYSVILIDFDLRKPDVAGTLGLPRTPGWGALLTSNAGLAELLVEVPQVPNLRVLTSQAGDAAFVESLIRSLPDLLAAARNLADYVVLDTAPLGEVSDALKIAPLVDEIVLVARPRHTRRASFIQVRDFLERADARPSGLLLTDSRLRGGAQSGYYAYGAGKVRG